MTNTENYTEKKKFFSGMLTIYGRKPVLEALSTTGVKVYRLHLAESNKPAAILQDIVNLAKKQNAEIQHHSRDALSRISKNKKQDQGVAVDLKLGGFQDFDAFITASEDHFQLIALDNVTNPQNLGMIIRAVCASPMTGILLPHNGCAKLDSLVIKASAGTLFKARIIRCQDLAKSLHTLASLGSDVVGLDLNADHSLADYRPANKSVFVLGNETEGLSKEIKSLCNTRVKIPMANDVESLNVAVTAGIIAFRYLAH